MHPGPIALIIRSEVEQHSVVQQGWKRHAGLVERQPFELVASGANAPDVAFFEHQAMDEVDERTVVRPDRKVIMEAFPRLIDLAPLNLLVRGHDEQGIPVRRRVIHNEASVGRPVEF